MGKAKSGFTLVEIMIVVMIIGLLASLSYPSYKKSRDNAQRTVCMNNLRIMQHALDRYMMENPGITSISPRDLEDYYSKQHIPECPAGGTYSIVVNEDAMSQCDFGFGHEL
ncbi:MAG: type IV pilin protein [Kiritimatiellia bacterium]